MVQVHIQHYRYYQHQNVQMMLKKYMERSGFVILIDSKNQQEKCIFKKSLQKRLKYPEMILMPFYATGPFIFDSWPLGPKHKMQ